MTEPTRPRVVAVVVTFNRLGLLQRLVGRLTEIERLDEVVVVDNASTDGTGAWLGGLGARSEASTATAPPSIATRSPSAGLSATTRPPNSENP